MFKAIVDVGLKPFQLDRDERLLKAGLPAEELKKAAEDAATAADCVTHQQITSASFPFARYRAVLCEEDFICVCTVSAMSTRLHDNNTLHAFIS